MEPFDFSPETSSMERTVHLPQPPKDPLAPESASTATAVPPTVTSVAPAETAVAPAETAVASVAPAGCELTPSAPAPVKKQKNGGWMAVAIIAVCFSLLLGVFGIWAASNSQGAFAIPQSVTPSYQYRDNVEEGDKLTPQEIIKKVSPSVVTVSVEKDVVQGQVAGGFGTGIIYTDNGYILTNAHVVEGASSLSVTDYQGNNYPATLIGFDTESDTAVIKIKATGLTPAEFGESSKVVPGDYVIAIGTPYDVNLSYTATEGMVSALRKGLNFPELGFTLDLIQHDAAINSGNSGGPLVNVYGQIIGINSIKISGTYENLGFALQIDKVLPLAEEIMNTGRVSRPGIGISGATYETENSKGAYILSVVVGGPADKAGLKQGDIIIKAGEINIESIDQLKEVIRSMQIGDSMEITYVRNNAVHTTQLILEELTQQ